MWICGGGYNDRWLVCTKNTETFIPKTYSSPYFAPLHYSNTYCKYSGKVQCTSTSMCRTLSDKGMARDSVGWHCVDRWRHSVRSRTRDTFATPNAILIDSGRECPGVRFRHGVRDCGMFLDSHSTRSPVMLQ